MTAAAHGYTWIAGRVPALGRRPDSSTHATYRLDDWPIDNATLSAGCWPIHHQPMTFTFADRDATGAATHGLCAGFDQDGREPRSS